MKGTLFLAYKEQGRSKSVCLFSVCLHADFFGSQRGNSFGSSLAAMRWNVARLCLTRVSTK